MLTKIVVIILSILTPTISSAALFPLEITNIKLAGTGTPAIPSTNRIFRAYPGIEYNIRAAAIGGLYPYTYSLSNAPAGMTINSATGEITWTNPQSNSGTITLTVTDADDDTDTADWAITVSSSTDDFVFVQVGYSGTETGSITQPHSSIANMLADESSRTKIVYFRGGTHQMVDFNSGSAYVMNLDSSPVTWLEYPGETAVLQGSASGAGADMIYMVNAPIYFDGLTINDTGDYGLFMANASYHTIRRCLFDGLVNTNSTNENQGFIFVSDGGTPSSNMVVQDNEFTDFTAANAIGSLYYTSKTLIENNYIHDGGLSGAHGFCTPIGIKTGNTYYTIRGNKIIMPANATDFEIYNEMTDQDYGEFCFNFVSKLSGGDDQALYFFYPETFLILRNTFHGNIVFNTGLSDGPYTFTNNVMMGSILFGTYVTETDNLTGTYSSGISDSDGLLVGDNVSYVGTRGWQLADGSTPMSTGSDTTAPTAAITQSDPQAITANILTITGTCTGDDDEAGAKWRIGSAPDATHGTACTGTTNFSCDTSGYSVGANTLYVGCYDEVPNYGSDSITVNYTQASLIGSPSGSFTIH